MRDETTVDTGGSGTTAATDRLQRLTGRVRVALLVLTMALVGGGAGLFGAAASPAAQGDGTPVAGPATPIATGATPAATSDLCEALAPGTGAEAWVQTELYFGRGTDDTESEISDEDWQAFLDEEVTPRFPDGLTVLDGYGQFLNSSGVIAAEDSTVLVILYPVDPTGETSTALEEIRDAYEVQFDQESVLRVDTAPVCVGF